MLSLSDSQDCCSLWSTVTQLSSLTPLSTLHRPLPRVYRLSSCGRRSIGCRDNCVGVGGDRDTDDVTLLQSVEHACVALLIGTTVDHCHMCLVCHRVVAAALVDGPGVAATFYLCRCRCRCCLSVAVMTTTLQSAVHSEKALIIDTTVDTASATVTCVTSKDSV